MNHFYLQVLNILRFANWATGAPAAHVLVIVAGSCQHHRLFTLQQRATSSNGPKLQRSPRDSQVCQIPD
jgi:hypothetical protein